MFERTQAPPIVDHERLDVYRLAIDYVASTYRIAKSLSGQDRHVRNQRLRVVQWIPLNIAEGDGKQSLKEIGFSRSLEVLLWNGVQSTSYSLRARRSIPS
ncbi:MAG: four helix bundle protein [Pirellula sp.]